MDTNFNVLVIEDDDEKKDHIKNIVDELDVNMIAVSSGEDALFQIYSSEIDIILLDKSIKDMDSLEILETILTYEKTHNTSIILLTDSDVNEEYIIKAYELGMADYIVKPINYKILKYKIKVIIKVIKEYTRNKRRYAMIKKRVSELEVHIKEVSNEKSEIEVEMNIDALTKIPNRKMFDQVLEDEWYRLMRSGDSLAIMMIDIDFFKQYNDKYGHIKGDECLKKVAKVVENSFHRIGDFVARYGGEEFVVMIPNFDYEDAKLMADQVKINVENSRILHEGSTINEYLTISIGVATIIPNTRFSRMDLVDEADSALYLAKKSGRNIVKGICM